VSDCQDIRLELGAYALGLLDDVDRRRVEEHLHLCARCRAEAEELRAASGLLAGITPQDVAPDVEPPDPERALSTIAAARRRERRRITGALASAGLLAALAIALVVTLAARPTDPQAPTGPSVAMSAPPGADAAGVVRLTSRSWGTQIDLRADRLPVPPAGEGYAVWLVLADGRRVPAGTFRPASASTTCRVRLAGAVARSEVIAVGVSSAGEAGGPAVLRASVS